jgi:hypothetical protein
MTLLFSCAHIRRWEVVPKLSIISVNTVRRSRSTYINGTSKMVCTIQSISVIFLMRCAGQLSTLLEPDPECLPLLEAFFSTTHYPRLEWVHHLAKPLSKLNLAATALETAYQMETGLNIRKVRPGARSPVGWPKTSHRFC